MTNPLDMFRELENSQEYKRISNIRQFSLSLTVFSGNALELRKLLDYGRDPSHFADLWNVKNRPELDNFQIQVVRYLHNFVAAAKSLVDHSRRFYQDNYQSTGQFADYKTELKVKFAENPLAQFVNCLRQFCQHYEAPPIGCQFHYDVTSGASNRIFLEKGMLQQFSGWNLPAKEYLRTAPEQIDLYDIVINYERLVSEFYSWVQNRLKEIHASDLAIVERKRKEGLRIMGPSLLHLLSVSVQMHNNGIGQPEDIFLGNIDPTMFRAILDQYSDPIKRAQAMIAQVQLYVDVPKQLQDQILEAFEK